jgi:hypothetical protein
MFHSMQDWACNKSCPAAGGLCARVACPLHAVAMGWVAQLAAARKLAWRAHFGGKKKPRGGRGAR